MSTTCDLLVIGAGPAGAEAAATACELGLSVLVIDEARAAGGQVHRAPDPWVYRSAAREDIAPEGEALRERLTASGAATAFEHCVWHLARHDGHFRVAAVGPLRPLLSESAAVLVASGTTERFYPRPGWTLPGVLGLGAATVMLKAHRVLPGRRVVVAGPGPLAPLVARMIVAAGGEVVALVDPNPWSAWLGALPKMAARPDLLAQGAAWLGKLALRGVPLYRGWDIREIFGKEAVESVSIAPVRAPEREKVLSADAVCLGYGFVPSTEIYSLLGASQAYVPALGGWVPALSAGQRSSVPGLYGAGDGAGLRGAAAAPFSGRIAALSAARDLGKLAPVIEERLRGEAALRLKRAERFGGAMARLVAPRPSAMEAVRDETIVCRCEDIPAGELRRAVAEGAREINALKSATRCGMGPCGGRMCGEAAAALMQCTGLTREQIGQFTARPPLRPVPLAALTGEFGYDDIPIPELSPA